MLLEMIAAVLVIGAGRDPNSGVLASVQGEVPMRVFPLRERTIKELETVLLWQQLPRGVRVHVLARLAAEIRKSVRDLQYGFFPYMETLKWGIHKLQATPLEVGITPVEIRKLEHERRKAVSAVFDGGQESQETIAAPRVLDRHWCATCALANERLRQRKK